MTIRAKFTVTAKEQVVYNGNDVQTIVKMMAVYGNSPENKEFFKYTPSGNINVGVLPEKIADQFILGKDYYVDFIPVPENPKKVPEQK